MYIMYIYRYTYIIYMYTYILYRYDEIYIYIYLYEKGKRETQEIPKISRKFTTSFVKILEERSFVVAIV